MRHQDRSEPGTRAEADTFAGGQHSSLILIEVADFASLRRHRGATGAACAVADLHARIADTLPAARIETVARGVIEVALTVRDRAAAEQAESQVRACLASMPCDAAPPLAAWVGAAVAVGVAVDDPDLAEAAEAALDREKHGARGSPADDVSIVDLGAAIARGEMVLHYQPKLHVRRQAIASVEALIRWQHPTRGLILPNAFIPAAERTGAIEALTLWTLRQVVADQRALAIEGYDLPVFVNIAGALLSDIRFVETALELVRTSGAKLGFEITETSVIREPERAIQHLNQFAAVGIAIAIDDYGAGLSSLAYLKQLPASELKIDKLFVTQLASSHRDPLIVRSTIDLAHALEMEVVAEGVETATSLALLSVMGCDLVQGYLISRPLPLVALLIFLREEGHKAATEQAQSPLLGRFAAVRRVG